MRAMDDCCDVCRAANCDELCEGRALPWPEGIWSPFPEARARAEGITDELVKGFMLRGMARLANAYAMQWSSHQSWRDPPGAPELWRRLYPLLGPQQPGEFGAGATVRKCRDGGSLGIFLEGLSAGYLSITKLGGQLLVGYGLPRDLLERYWESLRVWRESRQWEARAPRPPAMPESDLAGLVQRGLF